MPYLFFNSLFFFFFSKEEDKSIKLFLYARSLLSFSSYFLTLILMINILARNITAVFLCAAIPFSFGCLFSTCPHWCGALRRHLYPMSRSFWGASDLISESDFTWGVLAPHWFFWNRYSITQAPWLRWKMELIIDSWLPLWHFHCERKVCLYQDTVCIRTWWNQEHWDTLPW